MLPLPLRSPLTRGAGQWLRSAAGPAGAAFSSAPPARAWTMGDVLRHTVAFVMAGGQGERLSPLTRDRAKPAVPFGGTYRIIDFTLSNCINSGLRRIHVLTQYKSYSLDRHIKQGWSILQPELGEHVDVLPPQQRTADHWYRGTADAVYQNIYTLEMERPEWVMLLGGDHIYKMDYSEMLAAHLERGADVTVACSEVSLAEATRMGVMQVDSTMRVGGFQEKPAEPIPVPGHDDRAMVSMGIYIFSTDLLVRELKRDAGAESHHDFGKNILPDLVRQGARVFAFPFRDRNSNQVEYWRDIGTLDSYYDCHMDLVAVTPVFNLYDADWPIRTYQVQGPPAKTVFRGAERQGEVLDSLVSTGCIISGGKVEHSVLSPRVHVHSWAEVADSVIFDDVHVGRHAKVRRAIIDKGVVIPDGETIGCDLERDRQRFTVTPNGVVVVPKGYAFA